MPRQSICVGVSGSVAAVKAPDIAAALLAAGVDVDLVVTEAAHSLMQAQYRGEQPWAKLQALAASHPRLSPPQESSSRKRARKTASESTPPLLRIHRDADEWSGYGVVGKDPVLHVELAKRNQVLLVAPLCANLLALGFSSNQLISVVRVWYYDLEVHPLARRALAPSSLTRRGRRSPTLTRRWLDVLASMPCMPTAELEPEQSNMHTAAHYLVKSLCDAGDAPSSSRRP